MAELKTRPSNASVERFLADIGDSGRREDCVALVELMSALTGEPARMWGPSIVGFGSYHYRYRSGREGDWFLVGFSPRKRDLTVYVMSGFEEHQGLMERLGKYKTGKCCLYLKRLADVDPDILRELLKRSVDELRSLPADPES